MTDEEKQLNSELSQLIGFKEILSYESTKAEFEVAAVVGTKIFCVEIFEGKLRFTVKDEGKRK